jgi:type IV secretory pathway VirB6-like protein
VLITSQKLRHYFQEYSISVVTDYPLGDILRNQDATGRISKWAVELGTLNIDFKPRTAIKSQALVDFMAGKSATNSNRASRALGDVFRWLAQA